MSEERADLILNMLRAIRGDITTIRERQEELIPRVGRVEREVATLRREIADLHGDFAGLSGRLDNLDHRVERRLDLVDEKTGDHP